MTSDRIRWDRIHAMYTRDVYDQRVYGNTRAPHGCNHAVRAVPPSRSCFGYYDDRYKHPPELYVYEVESLLEKREQMEDAVQDLFMMCAGGMYSRYTHNAASIHSWRGPVHDAPMARPRS